MKPKIALIVGHTAKEPGAKAVPPIDQYEYHYNIGFAQALSTVLQDQFEVVIYFRDGKTIRETYEGVAKWRPDASLELHFNAALNPTVRGTSTLCSIPNQRFAIAIQSAMLRALERVGREDRGLEIIHDKTTRGWLNVEVLDPEMIPNSLIEPFFGSSVEDCKLVMEKQEELCQEIKAALISFLKDRVH